MDLGLSLVVLVVAVAGLATVITEILTRDPRLLLEIVTDSRAMARAARVPSDRVPSADTGRSPSRRMRERMV
ncbi:hypothetical protein HL658_35135 [Azospirillum sp. RWY-5-1]|uniref:Uncharacterized protein n=1 Tax=Azospirillum oleiclasticum TaxID=2735135 RepID=A0ABX2TB77_9PROT|nr:hypothetical protein [Azospirillum oleiclasticum]NYZ17807.1 hypothetical protein [Azospirillum oleiclasticum]NYZ21436.1 hypothetical protein [Azospirillum oleiclasticum]